MIHDTETNGLPPVLPDPGVGAGARIWRLAGFMALGALYFLLLYLSWRRWPDLLVDFGRELYLPWQISEGKVLYRDLKHLFGPFSQYFNGILFKLAGEPSFKVLFWANIVIFGLFLVLVKSFVKKLAGETASWVACAAVLLVNGVTQQNAYGNYNFISPYSHEAAHGVMLGVAALYLLYRDLVRESRASLACAGLVLGFVWLTKTEIAFAALLASLWMVLAGAWLCGMSWRGRFLRVLGLLGWSLVPSLCFWIYFSLHSGPAQGLAALWEPWRILLFSGISANAFYRTTAGLDEPLVHLRFLAVGSLVYGGAVAASYRFRGVTRAGILLAGTLYGIVLSVFTVLFGLNYFARAMPVFCLAFFVFAVLRARLQGGGRDMPRWIALAGLSLFALGLIARMGLAARFVTNGFSLSLPAVILFSAFFIGVFPALVYERDGNDHGFRAGSLIFMMIFMGSQLFSSYFLWDLRGFPVGKGNDLIMAEFPEQNARNSHVAGLLRWLEKNTGPGDSLAVLPEGVMINFMARRRSSVGHINFMVPEMLAFGESSMLEDFKSNPPDYIALVPKNMGIYGVSDFGDSPAFGGMIMDWIRANYRVAARSANAEGKVWGYVYKYGIASREGEAKR